MDSRGSNHSEELNKLNNWSMHNENNNKLANYTQQQQESKEATKSSYELYQEAADLLGLSCSLCDNCRCMDCQVSERERVSKKERWTAKTKPVRNSQSGYFDCDDDDDESFSEQSLMDDEYDEYDFSYGYGQDEQHGPLHLTGVHQAAAAANQLHMTQAEEKQQQEDEQRESELELCYAVDCEQNCYRNQQEMNVGDGNTNVTQSNAGAELESKSEQRLAIDFDLINATRSQVLQNCSATFNGLSLLDSAGEQQVEPFT